MTMTLIIPNRISCTVDSFAAASARYAEARQESGEGCSTFPSGFIRDENSGMPGRRVAFISYNAKVWQRNPSRRDWKPGVDTPLFDPYARVAA